jgi:hypothetical protein
MVDIRGGNLGSCAGAERSARNQKRYGRKLAINGGIEYRMPDTWPNVDEEEVRNTVTETFASSPETADIFSAEWCHR